jgi:hypothetical protein
MEHVSWNKKMKDVSTEIDSWKPTHHCGSTGISVDTDMLYIRPFRSE